ncbi:MAG: peptidyl-prolyl cis-trans isomerase [Planctomycetota bacterium]
MKLFLSKWALCFLCFLMVACYSCGPKEQVATEPVERPEVVEVIPPEPEPVEIKPVEIKPVEAVPVVAKPPKPKPVEAKPVKIEPVEPSTIVGRIRDHVITRVELEKQVIKEIRANPDEYVKEDGSVDVKAILLKMIVEKGFIVGAGAQGVLEDPYLISSLKYFREMTLANLLLKTELQPRIKIAESEIDAKMKSDPKLTRANAKVVLERQKAARLVEQFYQELYKKLDVQKLSGNFGRASSLYLKLLYAPKEKQRIRFVKKAQIWEDLTLEERNVVLATFENGQVTVEDWFYALVRPAPNRRPRDLNTKEGVEKFLDSAMRLHVFIAEAKLRGLDKDEGYVKQVRDKENTDIFRKVLNAKRKEAKKVTEDEIKPYFDQHKEKFKKPDTINIDQIWCEDLKTAQKVKEELSSGKDFESVKQQYSLAKQEKPLRVNARGEGIFFERLWNAEPNEIAGPLKGFYLNRQTRPAELQVRWRIVKILAKKPGQAREYAGGMEREVKSWIRYERREEVLAKYRKELLKKYSYKIYPERVKNINPLNIP